MAESREQICQAASQKIAAGATTLSDLKALVGLDGFVDEIIAVVDQRQDHRTYQPIHTIEALGRKLVEASGKSSNYELVVKQMKLGGNGPIMANALAAAGFGVTYVGTVGAPTPHPVFAELAGRAEVIGIGDPGHTDALEFADGKIMLGKYTREMSDVNWQTLMQRLGEERLMRLMEASTLIGMVNWTMLPYMSEIWAKLLEKGIPNRSGRDRVLFIDLADPEKRTRADIKEAMGLMTRFQEQVDVILGLNLKESVQVAEVLGLGFEDSESAPMDRVAKVAADIRAASGVACVVIHPRRGAAAATAKETGAFLGPFVQEPKISTGAGDHFNAGFCLGRVLGLSLEESLCAGTATSGYYVRTAQSPSAVQLAEFVAQLPPPQRFDQ